MKYYEKLVNSYIDAQVKEHGTVKLVSNPDGWGMIPVLLIAEAVDRKERSDEELRQEFERRTGEPYARLIGIEE